MWGADWCVPQVSGSGCDVRGSRGCQAREQARPMRGRAGALSGGPERSRRENPDFGFGLETGFLENVWCLEVLALVPCGSDEKGVRVSEAIKMSLSGVL